MYYDGTKLLSLKDLNGDKPEIYISTSNRSAGKTTYFNRLAVNRFLKYGQKFMLIYRFSYELDGVADKFFKEIQSLFFNGYSFGTVKKNKGTYLNLLLKLPEKKEYDHCGYAVALNSADQIKKMSHLFADTDLILFDEFQSESNHYCPNEIQKFISVHTSVARGGGKQVRYVPVIMISNHVSILNPYYVNLGISDRLDDKTKFLRGDGFVCEIGFNESAAESQKQSAFNRAFSDNEYVSYSSEKRYLNDDNSFIEKMSGDSKYICTFKVENRDYALRGYYNMGIIYCDDVPDISFPTKISVTTDDHQINYVMLDMHKTLLDYLHRMFSLGCFRFKNQLCKHATLKLLSY